MDSIKAQKTQISLCILGFAAGLSSIINVAQPMKETVSYSSQLDDNTNIYEDIVNIGMDMNNSLKKVQHG